ncbi:aldehyde dehydrogenase family protein [Nonomuraea antimicrobica]
MTTAPPEQDGRLIRLPALTHRGRVETRAVETVHGVDGSALAVLSLCPDLLVAQAVQAQRRAPAPPPRERAARLAEAARRFRTDVLGGLSFAEHCDHVTRVSGHNRSLTEQLSRAVADAIEQAPERADQARPNGSARAWSDIGRRSGSGVWTRRGETLGAVLSGNLPTIQNGWLQALALGYRVAVRPSRREPFTAYRVVEALRAAGFRDTDAVYLPSAHTGATALLRRADLGLVYGGDDVKTRYEGSATIKVGGPGRSKTLVDRAHVLPEAVESVVEAVVESVTALSGVACVNTTAVFVEGDHTRFAADLAAALTARARARQTTPEHLGPRVTDDTARAIVDHLRRRAAHARPEIPSTRWPLRTRRAGWCSGPRCSPSTTRATTCWGRSCPSPACGSRRGAGRTGWDRCGSRSSSTPSPTTAA